MKNSLLLALSAYYLLTGLLLVAFPLTFYELAPGVVDTGPFNMHFIRDVGFAFSVSAVALAYGVRRGNKPVVVFGASWLTLHGIFHLVLWFLNDHRFGETALVDLVLVVLPAALLAYLALTFPIGRTR